MHVLCIGCGNMASAMIAKWLQHDISITTVSPSGKTDFGNKVHSYTHISNVPHMDFDFVFYMAKPHMIGDILPHFQSLAHIPFVTVAAGVGVQTYKDILGDTCAIIRLMPNTPCAYGQGVIPAYTTDTLAPYVRTNLESLIGYLGKWGWLENEEQMHAVTALSGSGVAYIYHLMECMAQIAMDMGLPPEHSKQWAIQTILGAGMMAKNSPHTLATLRKNVTSPNGVTEHALHALMDDDRLHIILHNTMHRAIQKSVELSGDKN